MSRHLLRVLLALYPRAWRDRYGAELAGLTEDLISAGEIRPLLAVFNLACGAAFWLLLFHSRRTVLAMAVAAIMAVAGSTSRVMSARKATRTPAPWRRAIT